MSKQRELIEKIDKIRELQELQEKRAKEATTQATELDDILAAARREHNLEDEDGTPLASSSRLMGPGGGGGRRRSLDPEAVYDASFGGARSASPEAFARPKKPKQPLPAQATAPAKKGVPAKKALPKPLDDDPTPTFVAARTPAPGAAPEAELPPSITQLIRRYAADAQVDSGEGHENTYLRQRSELEPRERTQTMIRRPEKKK